MILVLLAIFISITTATILLFIDHLRHYSAPKWYRWPVFFVVIGLGFPCFFMGCGDGRNLNELIDARDAIIEEYPIVDDAEDCITEPPKIYTSLGEVVVTFDLDCLMAIEKSIVDPEEPETGDPVDPETGE